MHLNTQQNKRPVEKKFNMKTAFYGEYVAVVDSLVSSAMK